MGGVSGAARTFRMLDPQVPTDYNYWVEVWGRSDAREPQAHPAYALTMTRVPDRLLCAVTTDGAASVILPFCIRTLPFDTHGPFTHDAITPYGYGGAYLSGHIDASWFWGQWDSWASSQGLAGIVLRNHLFADETLAAEGSTIRPLRNIVVDLTRTDDQLWGDFEGRVRTAIRRGRENGVEVVADNSAESLGEFHEMYTATMEYKSARDEYFFSLDSLSRLVQAMPGGVALFHAFSAGRLIASEMQLVGANNAYYFLSGASHEGRTLNANPVMKQRVISWLRERGCSRYVLGGGLTRDDPLYRYKRGYAPRGIFDFTVTFHEANVGAEKKLTCARRNAEGSWIPTPGYVPQYRAPGAPTEEARL